MHRNCGSIDDHILLVEHVVYPPHVTTTAPRTCHSMYPTSTVPSMDPSKCVHHRPLVMVCQFDCEKHAVCLFHYLSTGRDFSTTRPTMTTVPSQSTYNRQLIQHWHRARIRLQPWTLRFSGILVPSPLGTAHRSETPAVCLMIS